tara:strand:+ start:243 stop:527 length:285 start_codon:yes stop_codon:yes gene_type:complete
VSPARRPPHSEQGRQRHPPTIYGEQPEKVLQLRELAFMHIDFPDQWPSLQQPRQAEQQSKCRYHHRQPKVLREAKPWANEKSAYIEQDICQKQV